MKQEMTGWQWHQLDHMQIIYMFLQRDYYASTLSLHFLQTGCSSWCSTNSVKALKAICSSCVQISNAYLYLFQRYKGYRKKQIHFNGKFSALGPFKNCHTFGGYFGPHPRCHTLSHLTVPPLQILCHNETTPPAINAANVTRICNISGTCLHRAAKLFINLCCL